MKKIGKYEIVREIGKGATSAVYLALDPFSNREVAIKIVYPEALSDKKYGERFKRIFITEASLAGKLAHPHIVQIFDAVSDENGSYIVMEYVNGSTLEQYCNVEKLLPVSKIIEIIFKCCRALDYAMRHGVIHRDMKPANILLSGNNDIKITDFGAALTTATEITQVTGVGSPAYMSPQQVKDMELTHQTDIFSLGVVFYQLLTGRLPFRSNNKYSMIYQIINTDPPAPSTLRSEIPQNVDAVVARALQKKLEDRYQSWEEFAHALVQVFNNLTIVKEVIPDSNKFDTMKSLSFFKDFGDVELWEVIRVSNWNHFPPGTTLIREGDTGKSFFILAEGEVDVSKRDKSLTVLKRGECFGEMTYISKKGLERSASVTCRTNVTSIEINAEALNQASETCRHRFTATFLEILVERLSKANMRITFLD